MEGSKGKLEDFVQSLEHDADEYARVKARLHAINDLLVDTETSSTDELLAIAEDTRTLLADWDSVAGEKPPPQSPPPLSPSPDPKNIDATLKKCRERNGSIENMR